MPRDVALYHAAPIWRGVDCFIILAGWSVGRMDLSRLAGRRVIAVNSSIAAYPGADVLIFGDSRWWQHNKHRLSAVRDFRGLIVSRSQGVFEPEVKHMRQVEPQAIGGLSRDRDALAMRWTTTTAALNLALHFGVGRIGLLGADFQPGPNGETAHHAPHPWPLNPGWADRQLAELALAAPALGEAGIETCNLSPRSRLELWPRMRLEEFCA